MLSEELNSMIDAAIADGVITDKERQLIMKRAVREGQDPDEVEMIMEGKLNAQKKVYKPQNSKLGDVKKCPSCGATIDAFVGKCPECGYIFRNADSVSSLKKLEQILHDIDASNADTFDKIKFDPMGLKAYRNNDLHVKLRAQAISSFPVPNSKEDLLEFITYAITNGNKKNEGPEADAWTNKGKQAALKAKMLFHDDPEVMFAVNELEKDNKKMTVYRKKMLKIGLVLILYLAFLVGLFYFLSH